MFLLSQALVSRLSPDKQSQSDVTECFPSESPEEFVFLWLRRIYLSLPSAVSFLQSESLVVCDVAEDLVEKLRKFRFRKETNNAAIIMKIDKDKQLVVLDEEHEGISPDELKDELPERQPRYPS
ncbi:hypothetical protein DV515_00010924 [Chloebia gouldiae]|uniref:Glia maturation factor beta n=1 Tax=Chloebia gouldiae TaxID=44316 RepID=A0A3L8S7P4_CHLGU|nr:hypothetical protein DV515_00010924 [Chloebia gouldiae]